MTLIISKGWGLPLILIIGLLEMAVGYFLYGTSDISVFEKIDPERYWQTGLVAGVIVGGLGYYLNRHRRSEEERKSSSAPHTFFGIPVEYVGGFWMLVSLLNF